MQNLYELFQANDPIQDQSTKKRNSYIISVYGIADGVKRWRKQLTENEAEFIKMILTPKPEEIISNENTIQCVTIEKEKINMISPFKGVMP